MKSNIVYAGLFLGSLLVAMEIVLLVVQHAPEQTELKTESTTATAAPPDSLAARVDRKVSKHDSLTTTSKDTVRVHEVVDSKGLRDSLALLEAQLAMEQKKVRALSSQVAADTSRSDTASTKEKKVVAKLLEAMDAQGAAKILHKLDDKEVKEILFAVKKRQAGKILGSFDPERAARIIR